MYKTLQTWGKLPINWCRMSSINRMLIPRRVFGMTSILLRLGILIQRRHSSYIPRNMDPIIPLTIVLLPVVDWVSWSSPSWCDISPSNQKQRNELILYHIHVFDIYNIIQYTYLLVIISVDLLFCTYTFVIECHFSAGLSSFRWCSGGFTNKHRRGVTEIVNHQLNIQH